MYKLIVVLKAIIVTTAANYFKLSFSSDLATHSTIEIMQKCSHETGLNVVVSTPFLQNAPPNSLPDYYNNDTKVSFKPDQRAFASS